MVGATGFEPATTCTPSRCATRLRYAPGTSRRCDGLRGSGMYLPLPGGSSCSVGPGAAAGCCGGLGRVVQRALQHLAGPKRQYPACGDLDLLARLRIPPDARVLLAHLEVPEAGDLDLVPALQRLLHRVEDELDDLGGFLLGEAHLLVDAFDDVGLRHGAPESACLLLNVSTRRSC